jgi:hypothetical protein
MHEREYPLNERLALVRVRHLSKYRFDGIFDDVLKFLPSDGGLDFRR